MSQSFASSCRSGCGVDPATSAQVVDLPDVTMERVGSVCDRRLTDAAKGGVELPMIVAVVLRCWAYDNVVFTGSADRVVLLRDTARNPIESR